MFKAYGFSCNTYCMQLNVLSRRRRWSYCLLLIIIFSGLPGLSTVLSARPLALSHQRNVVFNHLGTKDGLSHANISAIVQDRHGFIWIGTDEGLNRYDGYHIESFFHKRDDPSSLSHDSIWDLMIDKDGNLWIATDSGFNRYDESTNSFSIYHPDANTEFSSSHNIVRTLYQDSNDRFWVGTESGLSEMMKDGSFNHYHHYALDKNSIGEGSVRAILEDSKGRFWVGTTSGGLNLFDVETGLFNQYVHDPDDPSSISENYIRFLVEDTHGRIWVATHSGGVSVLDPDTGKFKRFVADENDTNSLSSNSVKSLLVDHNGDIWAATDESLDLWQPSTGGFTHFTNDPGNASSLRTNSVLELFQDRGGVIWVGTYNGVAKWNARVPTFPHIKRVSKDDMGLPDNNVTAFAEDKDGNIWIGTYKGLGKWQSKLGSLIGYTTEELGLTSQVTTLAVDADNRLWIGTREDGIALLEDGKVSQLYRTQFADVSGTYILGIPRVYRDGKDRMWVTTYGGGVYLHLGDGRFRSYEALKYAKAIDLVEGHDGKIWIAVDGDGVILLDSETGEIDSFRNIPLEQNSLSSDNAISLLKTSNTIWIGTRDRGLNRYNPESRTFSGYNKAQGIASDAIYGLLEDENGRVWISGGKGLSVLDPETGKVTLYDSDHGLQSEDFNGGAYFKLSDGTFLFGGSNGFNAFDPLVQRVNEYKPNVHITRITKFNQSSNSPVPVSLEKNLELNYDDYVIGLEFVTFDYTAPEKNRYQYMLEGFDRGWIDGKDSRQVTYTNLDAGKYVFRVKGSNNDGIWNEEGAALSIVVHPPIWATWWAYVIYFILGVLALYRAQQVNLKRTRGEAEKRYNQRLQLYIESLEEASDCVLIADEQKKLLYANSAIKDIIGSEPSIALGKPMLDLLFSDPKDAQIAIQGLDKEGRWDGEVNNQKGTERFIADVSLSSVKDSHNKIIAYVSILRDISDRKRTEDELENHRRNLEFLVEERTAALSREIAEHKAAQNELAMSLGEKELLLKEVHHRVKNNMQVISSLLNIQAESIDNEMFASLLGESQQRIKSMSLIHENLYQSDNLLEIDFEDYIKMLANSLCRFYTVPNVVVSLDIKVDDISLDIETAVPCGLIINELISNSLKHAFDGSSPTGTISVRFKREGFYYKLTISDNGIGVPDDFDLSQGSTMGMEIVSILTQQLDGNLTFSGADGAYFEISFPWKEKEAA